MSRCDRAIPGVPKKSSFTDVEPPFSDVEPPFIDVERTFNVGERRFLEIFSQGQWQLLSIARAVAGEPKILLLDEITANLDAETEEMVLCALKYASEGRTVISISHRVYRRNGADQIRYLAIGS